MLDAGGGILMVDMTLLWKNPYVVLALGTFIDRNKKYEDSAQKGIEVTDHPRMESHTLLRATVRTPARSGYLTEL